MNHYSDWLVNRGYKQEIVIHEAHRADAINRESLLVKHPRLKQTSNTDTRINLSSCFERCLWDTLQSTPP